MAKRPTPSQIARAAARREAEIRAKFDAARAEARSASAVAGASDDEPYKAAGADKEPRQDALSAAKARIDAAGAKASEAGRSRTSKAKADAAPDADADAGSDDEVEYLGRASGAEFLSSLNAIRSAQMAASRSAALDNLANPLGQQSAAMMTEDYRSFLQGSEQLILATSGQAMAILLEDQVKGAEILAVIAVYQAAITAFGAEVSVVAGVMKGEFSS
jgi:hypothetical protein